MPRQRVAQGALKDVERRVGGRLAPPDEADGRLAVVQFTSDEAQRAMAAGRRQQGEMAPAIGLTSVLALRR